MENCGICEAENLEIKVFHLRERERKKERETEKANLEKYATWGKKEFKVKYMAAGIAASTAGILLSLTGYT